MGYNLIFKLRPEEMRVITVFFLLLKIFFKSDVTLHFDLKRLHNAKSVRRTY
jgi:hypothetical protein